MTEESAWAEEGTQDDSVAPTTDGDLWTSNQRAAVSLRTYPEEAEFETGSSVSDSDEDDSDEDDEEDDDDDDDDDDEDEDDDSEDSEESEDGSDESTDFEEEGLEAKFQVGNSCLPRSSFVQLLLYLVEIDAFLELLWSPHPLLLCCWHPMCWMLIIRQCWVQLKGRRR